jgi:membrane dipeptidase
MDEKAALQALDHFEGRMIASHANALALLKDCDSNRFLSDEVIAKLIEREGVIGVVPLNKFLDWSVQKGEDRSRISIALVADQIEHICQIAGDAKHVGIGSDSDGGFGVQSVPAEMDSAADLHKLAPILRERGFSEDEVSGIFGSNWIEFLNEVLDQ